MPNIAVIGVGGWGSNLVRNYYQLPGAELVRVCDLDPAKLAKAQQSYPAVKTSTDFDEVLGDDEVDAVVIATSAVTHYALAKKALERGKDVYVEKPFVLEVPHANELIELADKRGRVLMVGHLLEYHPVVNELKRMLSEGELGRVYYLYSQRLNLGTVRGDENALWSLAPHDFSVLLYLIDQMPSEVSAAGQSYLQRGVEDVVFVTLRFPDGTIGNVHVSWLDPHKIRRLTIVGSEKMVVFDDLEPNEKLRIYDKGVQLNQDYESFAQYVGLRFGDIRIPHIAAGEPLRLECQHFVDCINSRARPRSDGHGGLRAVTILDAAQRSLRSGGKPVELG